ncbi:MAG TPA: glycosyltransferase family 9 protein [Vicinamibacterales bacterium]|nr:glycosyltransferase family 9 protein [Vicinamibacterales bacterium]HPK71236.1 glycosyltransferase family 9 protein [Vicinamibacterales bacterium]
MVLTTPAVRGIRRARPDVRLSYLVEPQAAAVVARNPNLDRVIVAPPARGPRRWRADLSLALALRRERYDAVIDFHGGPRSSLFALATGAPVRVGYAVPWRSWMYTRLVGRPRGHRNRHSVDNQWDLAEALLPEIGRPAPDTDPVEMADDPGAASRVERRLRDLGMSGGHDLVVVHVGAGNEFRRWPEEAFAGVVAALASADPNRRIILTTGAAQAGRAETVRREALRAGAAEAAVAAACDLDLGELRALAARAAVFVGGDSGPAHIAATTATPMVVIYGPTTPGVWGPWRPRACATEVVELEGLPCRPCDQRVCEPGDFRCLRRVTPAEVASAAERAIERGRLSRRRGVS